MEFRILAHLLPVGPRSELRQALQAATPPDKNFFFALQLSGAYDEEPVLRLAAALVGAVGMPGTPAVQLPLLAGAAFPSGTDFKDFAQAIFPWKFLTPPMGKKQIVLSICFIDVQGRLVGPVNATPIETYPKGEQDLTQSIESIKNEYAHRVEKSPSPVDNREVKLSWRRPNETGFEHPSGNPDLHEQKKPYHDVPSELLYMSTLPPPVSARLKATLYFKLNFKGFQMQWQQITTGQLKLIAVPSAVKWWKEGMLWEANNRPDFLRPNEPPSIITWPFKPNKPIAAKVVAISSPFSFASSVQQSATEALDFNDYWVRFHVVQNSWLDDPESRLTDGLDMAGMLLGVTPERLAQLSQARDDEPKLLAQRQERLGELALAALRFDADVWPFDNTDAVDKPTTLQGSKRLAAEQINRACYALNQLVGGSTMTFQPKLVRQCLRLLDHALPPVLVAWGGGIGLPPPPNSEGLPAPARAATAGLVFGAGLGRLPEGNLWRMLVAKHAGVDPTTTAAHALAAKVRGDVQLYDGLIPMQWRGAFVLATKTTGTLTPKEQVSAQAMIRAWDCLTPAQIRTAFSNPAYTFREERRQARVRKFLFDLPNLAEAKTRSASPDSPDGEGKPEPGMPDQAKSEGKGPGQAPGLATGEGKPEEQTPADQDKSAAKPWQGTVRQVHQRFKEIIEENLVTLQEPTQIKVLSLADVALIHAALEPLIQKLPQEHAQAVWPINKDDQHPLEVGSSPWEKRPSGIRLRYGATESNQAVDPNQPLDAREAARQIAGVGLLVKRMSADEKKSSCWHIINAGWMSAVEHPKENKDHKGADSNQGKPGGLLANDPVLVPLRPVYENDVWRPEIVYDGRPLGVFDPLCFLSHGYEVVNDDSTVDPTRDLYVYCSVFPEKKKEPSPVFKVPPLRFGDWYYFAMPLIDTSGGLPQELTEGKQPFHFNVNLFKEDWKRWSCALDCALGEPANDNLSFAKIQKTQYLRRVPIGHANVLPKDEEKWPDLPADVVPIAPELWARLNPSPAAHPDAKPFQKLPLILLDKLNNRHPLTPRTRTFVVSPPTTDDKTLERWEIPTLEKAMNPAELKAALAQLKAALVCYWTARNNAQSNSPPKQDDSSPIDPAVWGLRFSLTILRREIPVSETEKPLEACCVQTFDPKNQPTYLCPPIPVSVTCSEQAVSLHYDEKRKQVDVQLPPGTAACLNIAVLISEESKARFFQTEDQALWEKQPCACVDQTNLYCLPADGVLLETVSDVMPTVEEVYAALSVALVGGASGSDPALAGNAVLVHLALPYPQSVTSLVGLAAEASMAPLRVAAATATQPAWDNLHSWRLTRQRWVWRGRPIYAPGATADPFGSPPLQIYDPKLRDQSVLPKTASASSSPCEDGDAISPSPVRRWEALASLGHGMIDRPPLDGLFPRDWTDQQKSQGFVALVTDSLEDFQAASYLRYGLTVTSRYMGVIGSSKGVITTVPPDAEQWRRLMVPYRGHPLQVGSDTATNRWMNPPRVLAVVPLTLPLSETPLTDAPSCNPLATPPPLLVILDEVAYREYGLGERLVAVTKPAIFEDESQAGQGKKYPFEVGPSPEHYTKVPQPESDKDYWAIGETDKDEKCVPTWGPFGFTFDTVQQEAGIGASAYILAPPPRSGPHWFARVFFRRELYAYVSKSWHCIGRSEEAGPYQVYFLPNSDFVRGNVADGVVRYQEGVGLIITRSSFFVLHPTNTDPKLAEDVLKIYRYFVLVTSTLMDAAGNAEAETPLALFRIDPYDLKSGGVEITARPLRDAAISGKHQPKVYGRVLEIQLNGKPAQVKSGLDDPDLDARTFWRRLLAGDVVGTGTANQVDADGRIMRVSPRFRIGPNENSTG